MKIYIVTAVLLASLLSGCAGLNPNPGERITDYAWIEGRYAQAIEIVKPRAEAGEPWAQLRIGMFYQGGLGIERNMQLAVQWYEKAAAQKTEGDWAEGKMIGATGRFGYFNQNSDARIAQRNLAAIFLEGDGVEKDLIRAYLNIRTVVEETNGYDIFFCCEFAGGKHFPAKDIANMYQDVLKEMTREQKAEAEKEFLQVKLVKIK
jgi:hypothetical protein